MTERVTYRVVRGERGGWNIEQENPSGRVSSHRTRIEAILRGRELAQSHEYSLLVVYDRDGHIDRQYTYGRHPHSTPASRAGEQAGVSL